MNDEAKIIANAKYLLKQYGVDASDYVVDVVDIGPDSVSLIVSKGSDVYFVAADDYLSDDETYIAQAENNGIVGLTPLKLLEAGLDGEYITIFDHLMVCKVYKSSAPAK